MEAGRQKMQSGFTLIELLVVVVIIAIVVSIGLVSLMNALDKARQRATMADMRAVSKALETYAVDEGHYPGTGDDMAALAAILMPHESTVLPTRDHWNYLLHYSSDGQTSYTLECYGKDNTDGANITVATRFDFDLDLVISNGQFTAAPE